MGGAFVYTQHHHVLGPENGGMAHSQFVSLFARRWNEVKCGQGISLSLKSHTNQFLPLMYQYEYTEADTPSLDPSNMCPSKQEVRHS